MCVNVLTKAGFAPVNHLTDAWVGLGGTLGLGSGLELTVFQGATPGKGRLVHLCARVDPVQLHGILQDHAQDHKKRRTPTPGWTLSSTKASTCCRSR